MISFLPPARDLQGRTGFELLGESYRPSTSTVLSAGFRSALEGPGSAIQDIEAGTIASETGNREGLGYFQPLSEALNFALFGALTPDEVGQVESQPIDEEAWKTSEYYRDGLPYQEGMTTLAASIMANSHDRQAERDFILSKASGAQTVGAFAAGLVGGFADVKQLPANVAAAVAVPFAAGLGLGIRAGVTADVGVTGLITGATSAGLRAIQASRAARVSAVLAEATVATIPTVETALANADITGREYSAGDAAFDLLVSAGLSTGIQVGGEAASAAWRRYSSPAKAAEVGRVATQQVAAGEKIDVGPLVRSGVSDFTPSRITPEEPVVRKVEGDAPQGIWEAALRDQVFRGKTRAEAETAAREFALSESLESVRQAGYDARTVARIEADLRVKESADPRSLEETVVRAAPEVQAAEAKLRRAEETADAAKPKQRKAAEAKVQAARAELQEVEARTRAAVQPEVARQREVLQRRQAEADKAIRDIQSREAAKRLPDYMKRQLDTSVEARAERSIDPRAVEVEQDKLEPVNYDNDAPAKPLTPEELTELQTLAIDDPVVKGYLAEWEKLQKFPDYVRNYAKCKAGL